MGFIANALKTVLMIALVRLAFNPFFSFLIGGVIGAVLGAIYQDKALDLIKNIPYALEVLGIFGVRI